MTAPRAWSGRHAQRMTALCLATYGDRCWLCGHHGATTSDHVLPRSRGGSDAVENLRPAHGAAGCPTCGRKCNQARGNRLAPARARRPASSVAWFAREDSP